ncbi:MAG: TonB-dependent receptor [Bacteroidales bacterium]|jgi:TonB-linked SusC/RagA family outer membrane protein|nr:TonB-dependent receptor [Bacteroidales bacterium]MCI2121919.1 TonB-dependent receptor [Bacteroidales bacterium]MCI2145619.1 TonB-dependent receptor [Bacteroidales bacterium]
MKKKIMLFLMCLLSNAGFVFAQVSVTGTVVSTTDNQPVVGASVVVKGTMNGTTTDVNGKFTLNGVASYDETIVVSCIGMKSVEEPAKSKMTIYLSESPDRLKGVVVVAYGTVKKSEFTGSAAVVDNSKIETPVSSFDKSLVGQAAGLRVLSNSGQPGSATTFRIRGAGSLTASNEPLYVIDGVATASGDYSQIASDWDYSSSNIMSSLNPSDIESITILKDAAAASLYGSRAANGVVVITTKHGRKGKPKTSFNATFGWASLPQAYNTMGSADYYKTYFKSIYSQQLASGLSSGDAVAAANSLVQGLITHNPYNVDNPLDADGNVVSGAKLVVDTDWQNEVFNVAPTQDYDFNVSGGTDNSSYFMSLGYFNQKGISPSSSYQRYSGKTNISSKATEWLEVGVNSTYSYSVQNTEIAGGAGASPMYNALYFLSGVPVYEVDSDGNYILDENGEKQYNFTNPTNKDFNPLAIPQMDMSRSYTYRLLASAFADVRILDNLHFKTVFSPDYVGVFEKIFWNKYHGNGPAYNGRAERFQTHSLSYTSTNTLSYDKAFCDVHHINLMLGQEYWKNVTNTMSATATNMLGDMEELSAGSSSQLPSSDCTTEVLMSYFGRAEYTLADRYNLSASLRRDGSSVFGSDYKWGTFWSLGASWQMEKESFLRDVEWINELKFKISYGTSGNNQGIGRYASLGLWEAGDDYIYGTSGGLGHYQLVNDQLRWESQGMFNAGVEFSIFNDRVNGAVEYFDKSSHDLLYDVPIAASNGLESITMNTAEISNKGVECTIGADVIERGSFKWGVNFNITASGDEIKYIEGGDKIISSTMKIWKEGYSQYEFYMPTWAGVDKTNGAPLWYVVDSDGNRTTTSDYSSATYELQGRATPYAYGGLTNTFWYKNFDLSILLTYSLGGKIYDGLYASLMHGGNSSGTNLHEDELDAWSETNTDSDIPIFYYGNTDKQNSTSSRFLYSSTNLRVKNITLSYTLPTNLGAVSNTVSHAKVFASIDNLCTWFPGGWKGYSDPDMYGIDGYAAYPSIPTPRTVSFGFNLNF